MPLTPGQKVEVRSRFDGSWTDGFRITDSTNDGYRVRRTSDDAVLPVTFQAAEVRGSPT